MPTQHRLQAVRRQRFDMLDYRMRSRPLGKRAIARIGLNPGASLIWSQVALDLGYFDQAHLVNDFRSVTGYSPRQYQRRLQSPAANGKHLVTTSAVESHKEGFVESRFTPIIGLR
jgi:AraC-like DNA-binding protein